MDHKPQVQLSNSYQTLITGLKKNLHNQSNFIGRNLIVLPSDYLKETIYQQWLQEDRIATGVRFINLNLAIDHLLHLIGERNHQYFFPKKDLISFLIEAYLPKLASQFPEIQKYTIGNEEKSLHFVDSMASIFMKYFIYGAFSEIPINHWQRKIYDYLLTFFDDPLSVIQTCENAKSDIQMNIHFFGFIDLPNPYLELLDKISSIWNVNLYLFSPSEFFWGDLLSKKKQLFLQSLAQKKEATSQYMIDLEQLLSIENQLLSECVESGQHLYLWLEDHDCHFYEDYKEIREKTLLKGIQKDIFTMSLGEYQEDDTVQLHHCPSRLREMEELLNHMHTCLREGISPEEIGIYCPNLEAYEPYISYVFSQNESSFGALIHDIKLSHTESLIQSFEKLLDLPFTFFTPIDVYSIIKCKSILHKVGVSQNELERLFSFIHQVNVHWGINDQHQQLLSKQCFNGRGSFLYAIEQWVLAFAFSSHAKNIQPDYEFSMSIPFELAEPLGQIYQLLLYLYEQFGSINQAKKTLLQWGSFFEDILEALYEPNADDEIKAMGFITSCLQEIKGANFLVSNNLFSFKSFKKRLLDLIHAKKGKKRIRADKPALHFYPLVEGAIKECKVICLIGFDEEAFPRVETDVSINILAQNKNIFPTDSYGKDRFLFLQLLMSAKQYLVISYSSESEDPQSLLNPSSLVDQLGVYPIKSYVHKPFSFALEYFGQTQWMRTYSSLDYELAKQFYQKEQSRNKRKSMVCEGPTKSNLLIKHLLQFAQHPIRHYINHALGVYLEEANDEYTSNDEFLLSYRDKAIIQKECLYKDWDNVIEGLKQKGRFPIGRFETVARQELETEVYPKVQKMKQFIHEPLFSLHLHSNVDNYYETDQTYFFPPISMKHQDISLSITGVIDNVTEEVLYVYASHTFEDLLKIWPLIIIYKTCFPRAKYVGLIKDSFLLSIETVCFSKALESYLSYYISYSSSPSLLLPEWGKALLIEGKENLEKKIQSAFSYGNLFPDRYLLWLYKQPEDLFAHIDLKAQITLIQSYYQEFLDWYETL